MTSAHRTLQRWLQPAVWIALGMTLRLVHMATLGNRYFFGDTPEYQMAALRILHGMDVSATGPRAPLYPLFMALSFRIGGEDNFVATRLLQLVLALALMLVIVRTARSVGGGGAAAVAAPAIALAPTILFVSGLLYPTLLYMLLLAAVTLLAWELSERPSAARGFWFGVLALLGWTTDMVILAPLGMIGAWLLWRVRAQGIRLVRALAVAGATAAVVATPYVLHLQSRHTESVFMSKAQAVLHQARTDTVISRVRAVHLPSSTPFVALPLRKFLAREAELFRARPAAYLHDIGTEFFHFYQPIPDRVTSVNRYNTAFVLFMGGMYFVVLLTLAVLGVLCGAGPLRARLLLAGVVVATAAFYSFFFTQARYRIPVEPHLIVLASLGVARAFPRFTGLFAAGAGATTAEERAA